MGMFKGYDPAEKPDRPKKGLFAGPKDEEFLNQAVSDAHPYGTRPTDPGYERAARTVDNFMRALANGVTFGGADKLAGAMGEDAENWSDQAKKMDPIATVAGDITGLAVPTGEMSKLIGGGSKLLKAGAEKAAPAVAKYIPNLSKNTMASISGNQALTGLGATVADSAIRNGELPSPIDAAASTAGGAILGPAVHGALRALPKQRVRAMATHLEPGDIDKMKQFSQQSLDLGIPLTTSEVANHVIPSKAASIVASHEDAIRSPKGSQVFADFNADRRAKAEQVGRAMVDQIGNPVSGQEVANSADDALKSARDMVSNSARPYYQRAEQLSVDPSDLPPITPGMNEAAKDLLKDDSKMDALNKQWGGKPPPRSILFLDAVKKNLDRDIKNQQGANDPHKAGILSGDAADLTAAMDATSPDYTVARGITEGGKGMTDALEAGPLGQIAKNQNPSAQAGSLFGVTNEAERQASEGAIKRLPNPIARGVLANRFDSAISSDPLTFGHTALPNVHAEDLARGVMGPDFGAVEDVVGAAKAIRPAIRSPYEDVPHYGPWGKAWSTVMNAGKGKTAAILNTPEAIDLLGKMGPLSQLLMGLVPAANTTAIHQNAAPRRRE